MPETTPVLRTPEASKYLGLAVSTLEKMRLTGAGPRFLRLGLRAIAYRREDLDAWLQECARRSTSDPGASSKKAA